MTAVDTVIAQLRQERFSGTNESIRCVNTDLQAALSELQTYSLSSKIANYTILSNIAGALAPPVANTLTDILDAIVTGASGSIITRKSSGSWAGLYSPVAAGSLLQANGLGTDLTWASPGQITGINDGSAATYGHVGEYIASTVPAPGYANTTATYKSITSVTLSPGDWDVSGYISFTPTNTTNVTQLTGALTTDSTGATAKQSLVQQTFGAGQVIGVSPSKSISLAIAPKVYNAAANQIVYLMSRAVFTVSTIKTAGRIRARRMR